MLIKIKFWKGWNIILLIKIKGYFLNYRKGSIKYFINQFYSVLGWFISTISLMVPNNFLSLKKLTQLNQKYCTKRNDLFYESIKSRNSLTHSSRIESSLGGGIWQFFNRFK
jgi:hypothetical protein